MNHPANVSDVVHGTALALEGKAVLIRGPSGAGKSDLALRCIAAPALIAGRPRIALVSDDQVSLRLTPHGIEVAPPLPIAGKIEVRGIGVVELPYCPAARLVLVIDLVEPGEVPRYPLEPSVVELLGITLPSLPLAPFEASAPTKVALALAGAPDVLTPR